MLYRLISIQAKDVGGNLRYAGKLTLAFWMYSERLASEIPYEAEREG